MKFLRRKKNEQSDLDISPLIDVVFILLIFFMVSTTFIKDSAIEIERPSASSGSKASTKAIRIHVDRVGNVYLDDAPVKPWVLQSRVKDNLRDNAEGSVLIIADRRVAAEKLIEVVDQCRLAGAKDVGVVTDAEAG